MNNLGAHRANLMRKLDRHNASELTAHAIEKGLVEIQSVRRAKFHSNPSPE